MATYEEIYGKRVEVVSSDPTLSAANEGQVWYNSTTGTLKGVVKIKAVSSGANTSNSKQYRGGCGTQAANLVMGGEPATNSTEEYDSISWSAGGNWPASTKVGVGLGTQTAAIGAGGGPGSPPQFYSAANTYNGSSWTGIPALNTARGYLGGCGTTTAGLVFGGCRIPGNTAQTHSEEYNGASWSEGSDLLVASKGMAGAGIQTAALGYGGSPNTTSTYDYNGTSWSAGDILNTKRGYAAGATDSASSMVILGGNPGSDDVIEEYDGTSWMTVPATLGTGRSNTTGGGSSSAAIVVDGSGPSNKTEEYDSSINVITAAAWASGTAINTPRTGLSGAGTTTAGLVFGGYPTNN